LDSKLGTAVDDGNRHPFRARLSAEADRRLIGFPGRSIRRTVFPLRELGFEPLDLLLRRLQPDAGACPPATGRQTLPE
ncbi:MAG: hypothetical protein ACREYF_04845, partial [Gammaproteobacteria bacterium]